MGEQALFSDLSNFFYLSMMFLLIQMAMLSQIGLAG